MKRYTSLLVLAVLALLAFSPVDIPFTLDTMCRSMPLQEWALLKDPNGTLSISWNDHLTGAVKSSQTFNFERGDVVEVQFNPSIAGGKGCAVLPGDTLAILTSSQLGERLVQLKNQLAIEKANLQVVATGQKPQIIKQLEAEIALAEENSSLKQKQFERTRQLFAEGLVAKTDLEAAENAYQEAHIQVDIAKKALAAADTGDKQESQRLAGSQVASLQQEINFLENRQGRLAITAPFGGLARFEQTPLGDKLVLEDTAATVLLAPVQLRHSRYFQVGMETELTLAASQLPTATVARVAEIGDRVEVLDRRQVVFAKLVTSAKMPKGTPFRCRLSGGEVRVSEFLRRSLDWE
ncbi:MAG: hypothetical protein H6577_26335 [Lewinellaceae bacterium]|nr:hypothetical protein [Saprospiraceae bacterium]MCB9341659.1 hypothetical protein [Lewinellaceae bacterium]